MRKLIWILVCLYICRPTTAQDLSSVTQLTEIKNLQGVVSIPGDRYMMAGSVSEQIAFHVEFKEPALELRTKEGTFIDSASYKQFSYLNTIHLRDDGRILGLAADTLENRYFFVTIAPDLSDLKLDRFLSPTRNFTITRFHGLEYESSTIMIDATIFRNQINERVTLYYDDNNLTLIEDDILPEDTGDYIRLEDGTIMHVKNDVRDETVVTWYDQNLSPRWTNTYRKMNFESAYSGPDGRIYLAGREFISGGLSEALIIEIDSAGTILNSARVTEGPMWNFQIRFTKILPYQDKIAVVGTNNFNSDSWQAYHNFMLKIYDRNLNEWASTSSRTWGENALVIESKLIGDTFFGVAQSFPFESSASYQFIVDVTQSTSTHNEISAPITIHPNPVVDLIHIGASDTEPFTIFDSQGRLCLSGQASGSIDVSQLDSGHYLLRLGNGRQSTSLPFVKL